MCEKAESVAAMVSENSSGDLIETIKKLTSDLARSREETRKAEDQITCLVSLIKRSWRGEKTATSHLANIIGVPDPHAHVYDGEQSEIGIPRKDVRFQTNAVANWERLSLKILEREYVRVEREIQKRQNMYIRHRELYLEELLNSHDENMAGRIPLARKPSNPSVEEIDNRFLQQQRAKSGHGSCASSAPRLRPRRQLPSGPRDEVQQANVHLSDFFIQNTGAQQENSTINKGMSGLFKHTTENQAHRTEPTPCNTTYDDPNRYTQPKLFKAVPPAGKKIRPVSAVVQRERGRLRARPKSAGFRPHTVTTEGIRVTVKMPDGRPPVPRLNLAEAKPRLSGGSTVTRGNDGACTFTQNPFVTSAYRHPQNSSRSLPASPEPEELTKPSITVRIRSATKRPECIDNFQQDLQKMSAMEDDFRKTTLQLQKKLGISNGSLVY